MFVKVCVILFFIYLSAAQEEDHVWDLAVAINNEVELLTSNGSLVGIAVQEFNNLKALTFDVVRHQFVVSDMDDKNDTIFTIQLTKETEITPVIQDLPDDVQDLAVDPITDILYWTDSKNRTINYISLKDPLRSPTILFEFDDQEPQGIAVDSCRGFIYWTNAAMSNPSIERGTLDGKIREVLVTDDLFMPAGIAIDYLAQRIYWANRGKGIYYSIESTDFKGENRLIVHEGTHQKPFGVAIDKESVYWTDVNNNALWRKGKRDIDMQPEKLRDFKEHPMGVFAKHIEISHITDCRNLEEAIKNYNESTTEYFEERTDAAAIIDQCLNGGQLTEYRCKCHRGYSGTYCEISICYNYCVHGTCHLSTLGYSQCMCSPGYSGSRCERNSCDGYCLNSGECRHSINRGRWMPVCKCREGYRGARCEISTDFTEFCEVFCDGRDDDVLVDEEHNFVCRCSGSSYNLTRAEMIVTSQEHPISSFIALVQHPVFISMVVSLFMMLLVIIILVHIVFKARGRPRIKKRIIVNKNITPLTYRQPPTEQCEITIENCCNMNVCETPCFEPPTLRSFSRKKEEKKNLLSDMETGDDLY